MMSVSGYEEKVPANIKEDNATKLAKILQEFDFFEKESARLVAETENSGNEQQKKWEHTKPRFGWKNVDPQLDVFVNRVLLQFLK